MILASGRFLTACVAIVLFAVLSRLFDLRDYGTYRQVLLAYAFLAPLLILGLPQGLYFFLPGEERAPRRVLCENLALLFAAGALFSGLLLLGAGSLAAKGFHNPALASALVVFAAYPLFAVPLQAFGPCLMARDRPRQVAAFNVASRLFLLAAVLAAVWVWRTVSAALIATVVATACSFLVALWLMLAACPGHAWRPRASGLRAQLKFGIPLGIAGMLGILTLKLGQVIVSAVCSPEQFAVYANGAFEIPLIAVITGSIIAVITPDLARCVKGGEHGPAIALWRRAMVKSSTLLLPMMVFLMVWAPDVIVLLFSAKYAASVVPFRILLLAIPLRATSFGAMFLAANRNQLVLYRSLVDLAVAAVLSVVLVQAFGILGGALGIVLMLYIWHVPCNVFLIGRLYGTPFRRVLPLKRLGLVLVAAGLASVPALAACGCLPAGSPVLRLGLAGVLFVLTLPVVFVALGVHEFQELAATLLPPRALAAVSRLGLLGAGRRAGSAAPR